VPSISIYEYMVHLYEKFGCDGPEFILIPFAYINQLENTFIEDENKIRRKKLGLNHWNMHK